MVVYPEGIWYCGLTAEAIDCIVDKHFVGGRVVEEYAREPGRHDERQAPEEAR
jgi:(2Fe-2S) ferredoxin